MARVAFLGLGRMGAPMATNLAAAGHELVLHNRTRATAEELAARTGATVAASPRTAATGADVVITMLANETALRAVYEGDDGVLAGLGSGAVAIDMGTTGPAGIERLAGPVAATGAVLVDAPVSGSTAAAEAADLTILVGAPDDVFHDVRPILVAMGDTIFHLGDTGAGSVMKLAVNTIIHALGNAVSEALVLAERAGLDRTQVYEVFEQSAVAAPMVHYRHDAFLDPEHTPVAFAVRLAHKDLELVTALATEVGVPMAQARTNLAIFAAAMEAGLGDNDMADVAVHLRRQAGG
jgi:3-hydroxyisobutyrate dehydrogenase-like beta-hydroxyacid dehydrogenase